MSPVLIGFLVVMGGLSGMAFLLSCWSAVFYNDVPPWPNCWVEFKREIVGPCWEGTTWIGRVTITSFILYFGSIVVLGNLVGNVIRWALKWIGTKLYYVFFKA